MGMYTELSMGVRLAGDTPENVVSALHYMTLVKELGDNRPPDNLPQHALFEQRAGQWSTSWTFMLWSDSYYFDAEPYSEFKFDHIAQAYFLTVRCNLKNYRSEIELFLDLLAPYVDMRDHDRREEYVGTYRYEEMDWPTLIFFDYRNRRFLVREITGLGTPIDIHECEG